MIHAVDIEGTELLIGDDDRIGLHIIRQIFVGDAVIDGAVQILEENGGVGVHGAQLLPPGSLVELRLAAVDGDHIRKLHRIGEEFAHIGHVVVKGAAVGGGDHLGPVPEAGEPEGIQLVDAPHGIVFQDDTGGLMLIFQLLETFGVEFLFLLEHDEDTLVLFQGFPVPFLFAVLTADDENLSAACEAFIAQNRETEGGFTAFKEAGEEINRYKSANHR